MYRRDVGVLFLSLFAIFWALQHEGTYQYYPAFYHQFDKDPGYLETPGVAPPPVVVRDCCCNAPPQVSPVRVSTRVPDRELHAWRKHCDLRSLAPG